MKNRLGTLVLFGIIFLTLGCTDKTLESQKYIRLADIALYESRIEKARELFEKAAELNPKNEEAWYGIGLTYMNREKYHIAIQYFGKAIELNATYTNAFYNRGQAYFYLGEVYRACDDWHIAFDLGKPNMTDKLRKCE